MKDTGMARKVDDLGRIVLPVELRRLHGIQTGDALEISVDGDAIVLRKLALGCVFCGIEDGLRQFKGRVVCGSCTDDLAGVMAGWQRTL
jgi:AbrB family transcriptional regulator, transcriptional pleiotropic regulator of transition state genes